MFAELDREIPPGGPDVDKLVGIGRRRSVTIARHPEVRDRPIFVRNPGDIVSGTFGPELSRIRQWTDGALLRSWGRISQTDRARWR
jgi:hypothetical protein